VLVAYCVLNSAAQKVQYSRHTAVVNYPDAIQLVANVSGHHHLLSFFGKHHPVIYIYDQKLQLVSQIKIPYLLPPDCEIKIVPFPGYYYLYMHVQKTARHELWKINDTGKVIPLTDLFLHLVQSQFKNKNSSFKISCIDNRLYVMCHTYFKEIGKIKTTIVQTDSMLSPVLTRNIIYNFTEGESLQRVTLTNSNDLLALKTANRTEGNILEVLKVNIHTGYTITKTFTSEGSIYSDPGIAYNVKDSGMLLYSRMRNPLGSTRNSRAVFMCRLNALLNETQPIALLKGRLNYTGSNFILAENQYPWISLFTFRRQSNFVSNRNRNSLTRNINNEDIFADLNVLNGEHSTIPYNYSYSTPGSIRFTRLDERLKIIRDSVIVNNDPKRYIDPNNFGRFIIKNKSYLLMLQRFGKRNGLMLVYTDDQNQVVTSDVRVLDKNEYILSQLQPVSDRYVILPYKNGREAGLLKIEIE